MVRSRNGCHKMTGWCFLSAWSLAATCWLPPLALAQKFGIVQDLDPSQIAGADKCAECHAAEHKAWLKSSHATDAWSYLTKPDAGKIASKLGIASPTSDSTCTTCHGTQHAAGVYQHVSCESCHNSAGADDTQGWIKLHSDFGAGLDPKHRESRNVEAEEHYRMRMQACDAAGMRRSSNLFSLAKNCIECHVIGSQQLVDVGGHPTQSKGFEFFEWAQGEVRHNYQVNPSKNAAAATIWVTNRFSQGRTEEGHQRLMYVVGQLADLAVSLRNRSQATAKGEFLKNANDHIEDALKELEDVVKKEDIPEVKAVVESVAAVEKSLKNLTAEDAALYARLADEVSKAGQAVAEGRNGADWKSVKLPRKSKGEAQP